MSATHQQIFAEELNAEIDEQVLPLVRALNRLGVRTISSCQGDPGQIEVHGGMYGGVCFRKGDWREISAFCFGFLFPLFIDQWDDVRVEVNATATWGEQWEGWIRFRNESIPLLVTRLNEIDPPVNTETATGSIDEGDAVKDVSPSEERRERIVVLEDIFTTLQQSPAIDFAALDAKTEFKLGELMDEMKRTRLYQPAPVPEDSTETQASLKTPGLASAVPEIQAKQEPHLELLEDASRQMERMKLAEADKYMRYAVSPAQNTSVPEDADCQSAHIPSD